MKTIRLHGWLGKQFGEEFCLNVATPAEGIRALCVMLKDFQKSLAEDTAGFNVYVEDEPLTEETLQFPFSDRETFHIVPAIAGAKQGTGELIFGLVLLVAAFWTAGTSLSALEIYGGVTVGQVVTTLGVAFTLGGLAQMIFAPPKATAPKEAPTNTPSYNFNGAVNTLQQGNAVALCYGEIVVGSQVASAGIYTEDFSA